MSNVIKKCNIHGLKFSASSNESISEIKRKVKNMQLLSALYSSTAVYSVFFKNNLPTATYNISTYDWDAFARGVASIPKITRRIIKDEAFSHFVNKRGDELKFWMCVHENL